MVGLAVLVACGATLVPTGPPAGAAGMTTHAWMAESAIDLVEAPALEALLEANRTQVRAGARFPDGGYGPGNVYGEEAHWQRFTDVYAGIIRDKESCGDLTAPTGPCAAQIAHLMGIVAHGTGDEVWDWLFEPNSPDLDEYYLPEELAPFQDGGGQELVMDLVAIGVHHRPGGAPPALPSVPDLLAAFEASGQEGVTAEQLAFGQQYIDIVYAAESGWARNHLAGVPARDAVDEPQPGHRARRGRVRRPRHRRPVGRHVGPPARRGPDHRGVRHLPRRPAAPDPRHRLGPHLPARLAPGPGRRPHPHLGLADLRPPLPPPRWRPGVRAAARRGHDADRAGHGDARAR